jgi:hypothetical protein
MKNMELIQDTGALHTKAQTERTLKEYQIFPPQY